MPYFNRPILVRNALASILKSHQHHDNWELAFGDDNSIIPGRPIVEEMLAPHLNRVKFYESRLTFEEKVSQGLLLGKMANEAVRDSQADIAIILCDDDELVPTYLHDLSDFYRKNPDILYAYSKVHIYNPLFKSSDEVNNLVGKWNQVQGPINPVNKIDATQVSFRLSCCKQYGAWFQETTKLVPGKPWARDTDKGLFENLFSKCGMAYSTGLVGQYKGTHDYQLLWHKNVPAGQLYSYYKMTEELAGKAF